MISKNQIKQVIALQLKKNRDTENLFIAEGVKTVEEILEQKPEILHHVYAIPEFIKKHEAVLKSNGTNYTETDLSALIKISLLTNPNQVVAVCRFFTPTSYIGSEEKNYLYLDDMRDPGNLGTIIRLADWFGISTIFCSPASADHYNPKVIQASMGSFLRVQVIYKSLDEVIADFGFTRVYGAVLNGKSLHKCDLKPGLIVIGNEANGISEANLLKINNPITIPAHPLSKTESLNAAMATAIICHEFFKSTLN
jgi:RNA methyltransferase, TrmH family